MKVFFEKCTQRKIQILVGKNKKYIVLEFYVPVLPFRAFVQGK